MSDVSLQAKTRSFLNENSERHASVMGFVVAFALGQKGLILIVLASLALASYDRVDNKKALRELRKEPWYSMGGAFIGFVVQELELISQLAGLI